MKVVLMISIAWLVVAILVGLFIAQFIRAGWEKPMPPPPKRDAPPPSQEE